MARQPPAQQRAQGAAEELRDLIRQAHEAAQHLEDAIKAARRQVDEYAAHEVERVMNTHLATTQRMVSQWQQEAADDVRNLLTRLNTAMSEVVSIVELRMAAGPPDVPETTADFAIDLREQHARVFRADGELGRALLREAQHKIVIGPANAGRADRT